MKDFLQQLLSLCLRICSSVCTLTYDVWEQSSSMVISQNYNKQWNCTYFVGLHLPNCGTRYSTYFSDCNSLYVKQLTSRQLIIPLLFKVFQQKLVAPRDNLLVNSLPNFNRLSQVFHGHSQLFYNLYDFKLL